MGCDNVEFNKPIDLNVKTLIYIKDIPIPFRKIVRMIARQYYINSMRMVGFPHYKSPDGAVYRTCDDVCEITYSNNEGDTFKYKFNFNN